jgi:hypothetical protein
MRPGRKSRVTASGFCSHPPSLTLLPPSYHRCPIPHERGAWLVHVHLHRSSPARQMSAAPFAGCRCIILLPTPDCGAELPPRLLLPYASNENTNDAVVTANQVSAAMNRGSASEHHSKP